MMIWKKWINKKIFIDFIMAKMKIMKRKKRKSTNKTRPRNIIIIRTLRML